MSDDALAQSILNPINKDDGFGPEKRSKGEAEQEEFPNDLEIKEPTTEDELGSDLDSQDDHDDDEDDVNHNHRSNSRSFNQNKNTSRGGGGGYTSAQKRIQTSNARTGPKGVLRDRHESDQAALKIERERIKALNFKNSKKLNFSALTIDEENKLKKKLEREIMRKRGEIDSDDDNEDDEDDDDLEGHDQAKFNRIGNGKNLENELEEKEIKKLREKRLKELRENQIKTQALQQQRRRGLMSGAQSTGRWFGHLREVDEKGFVKAVEEDGEGTSVVVHIYGKSVPACIRLTSSLSSLARLHPRTKFLQVKASSIGFGSSSTTPSSFPSKATSLSAQREEEDLKDEDKDYKEGHEEDGDGDGDEEDFDLDRGEESEEANDVLPTILIYRKGQLEANLVRPDLLEEDWRGGDERGIREILIKYGALSTNPTPHDDFSYAWNDVTRAEDE